MRFLGLAAGTAIVLGGAAIIGAYETSDEKSMPNWAFWTIIVIAVPVIGMATLVWLGVWVVSPALRFVREHRWEWPLRNRDAPDPNQWLLDIAKDDAGNPAQGLIILSQSITDKNLAPGLERPWIEFGLMLLNVGVYRLKVGPITGHARYNGIELKEAAEDTAGWSTKPRWHQHVYKVKQFITPQQARELYEEIDDEKAVYSISLSGVQLEVQSEAPGAAVIKVGLGKAGGFPHGDG